MTESVNQLWARALVEELARSGVRHAVVCPGSRSTPIALACADQPGLRTWSVVDERSAAFFALGIAKESGAPALVLATSGTAGAHFFPAVIEARMAGVPLIALTADRPLELHGWGAPQTLSQAQLFGSHARWFADLGIPEATPAALLHLRATACRAVSLARAPPRGAVHLNAPFREPLAPPADPGPVPPLPERALRGAGTRPLVELPAAERTVALSALDELREELRARERGVIVLGPRDAPDGLCDAANALGRAWGYPVLAEAASNGRYGHAGEVIALYDALLRHAPFASAHVPEIVLRFGGGLTPKGLQAWIDGSGALVASFSEGADPMDPGHSAARVLEGDPVRACRALAAASPGRSTPFAASFREAERRARAALEEAFTDDALTEPRTAYEVARALPRDANLFVSSSMPIRDLDGFAFQAAPVRVLSNRGANGIDGVTSTALGVAASSGRPTALLTGDLAFLHDLGGLVLAARERVSLAVIVVNNDGGGIFSFLPVAGRTPHFEALFGTHHGLDLGHAAALCGSRHVVSRTASELRGAVRSAVEGGLHVIEVRTDRAENVRTHQALYERVAQALGGGPWA